MSTENEKFDSFTRPVKILEKLVGDSSFNAARAALIKQGMTGEAADNILESEVCRAAFDRMEPFDISAAHWDTLEAIGEAIGKRLAHEIGALKTKALR